MKKPTKTALSIFLLCSSTNLWADTLLDIYNLAKDNDPTFLASETGRSASNERVNQSFASLLPQLSASFGYTTRDSESTQVTTGTFTPIDSSNPVQNINTEEKSNSETDGTDWSITLNQEIYNHSTWVNLRQSEKRALQSNINHEGAKQELLIRVSETYFNVLAAKDSVAFSKAETEAVSKELAQTKQRHDVGLIAMTDVHEAQSRHDRALANQIAAQNALDNAHEALQQITGQYHYNLLGIKENIILRNPQPTKIKQWVNKAENNNISIKASQIGLDIAKKSINLAQSGHFPTVNLRATYSDQDQDTTSPAFPRLDDFGNIVGFSDVTTNRTGPTTSIGVSINVPLYSGGNTNSQVKEAQMLYQQAVHNLELEHRRAVSSTRSAYLGVVAAVSSVNALKQAVISSQSALEATQAGLEVGTRTIVDVLLQTQQLFDAKRQHARARYDYILNTLKLKQATGLLTVNDLTKVNKMLR